MAHELHLDGLSPHRSYPQLAAEPLVVGGLVAEDAGQYVVRDDFGIGVHLASILEAAPISLMVVSGLADRDGVRIRVCLLAMVVAFGGIAAEGRAVVGKDVTALLLTKRDVGAGYSLNRGITHRWTLAERSEELSSAVRRELAAKWVAGAQTGFDGSASVSRQAIISTADVFRTSSVASIRKAWETAFIKLGSGARLAIPRGAPGEARFLMRGRMLSNGTTLEVLLYQWQSGKTLQSVWLIGRPGVPRVSRLIALARLQAA